jgi:hypothetical protein
MTQPTTTVESIRFLEDARWYVGSHYGGTLAHHILDSKIKELQAGDRAGDVYYERVDVVEFTSCQPRMITVDRALIKALYDAR